MIKHSQKSYSSLSCGTERTEQNQKKKKKASKTFQVFSTGSFKAIPIKLKHFFGFLLTF